MNGLRDMLYNAPSGADAGGGGPTLGASFGFNVGSETLRIQIGIAGLLLAAVAALVFLHMRGNRFSVHV